MFEAGEVREALAGLVAGDWDREDCALDGAWAQDAQDAGYNDADGFVLHLSDGSRYLVSLQQLRW